MISTNINFAEVKLAADLERNGRNITSPISVKIKDG